MLKFLSMLRIYRNRWESALVQKADAYLHEAFGLSTRLERDPADTLPHYIRDLYSLWRGDLFGRAAIFAAPKPDAEATVAEMEKHARVIGDRPDNPVVILLFEALTTSHRRALLSRRVAFLVPMAQLYVPEALLDLRERTPRSLPPEPDQFTPTAQLAILGALLSRSGADDEASATDLARRYGVAIMSMTRAFDELEAAELADTGRIGRQRALRFKLHGRALWDKAAARLQSPVRKVRTVVIPYPDRFVAFVAGESALAHYTSLARPRIQRLAVAAADWNQLVRDHGLRDTYARDPEGDEIETWAYDPAALAKEGRVDPLSLHLSLRDHPDERVAGAAAELLETLTWS